MRGYPCHDWAGGGGFPCPGTGVPSYLGLGYPPGPWYLHPQKEHGTRDWSVLWKGHGTRTRVLLEGTWDQRLGYPLEGTWDQRLGYPYPFWGWGTQSKARRYPSSRTGVSPPGTGVPTCLELGYPHLGLGTSTWDWDPTTRRDMRPETGGT